MLNTIIESPTSLTYWNENITTNVSLEMFKESCVTKIAKMKDKKLVETNFKILQNILPCNKNLFRWKLSTSENCTICGNVESISHLLFECNYAQSIWKDVHKCLGLNVSLEMILFGNNLPQHINFVLSIVTYSIYKEWLICSFEKKQRHLNPKWKYFKGDFIYRKHVYENCDTLDFVDICSLLEKLIDFEN